VPAPVLHSAVPERASNLRDTSVLVALFSRAADLRRRARAAVPCIAHERLA
jgi:hypothetical protein